MLIRTIHKENDAHSRLALHRPVGRFHDGIVGAEDVANSYEWCSVTALFKSGIAAHCMDDSTITCTYLLWLRQGGQFGISYNQQLQSAVAVATFGGEAFFREGKQPHTVLSCQMEAVFMVLVARAECVADEKMVRRVVCDADGAVAASATVDAVHRNDSRVWGVGVEIEPQRGTP